MSYLSPREAQKQFEAQMQEYERQAREKFEAQLKAERERAYREYEAQLEAAFTPFPYSELERQILEREAEARRKFEERLKAYREKTQTLFLAKLRRERERAAARFRQQLGIVERAERAKIQRQIAAAKVDVRREILRQKGVHPSPRVLMEFERERLGVFQTVMGEAQKAEKTAFQKEIETWETTQKEQFGTALSNTLMDTSVSFEKGISEWKATELEKLQKQQEAYEKAYKEWVEQQKSFFKKELEDWERQQKESFNKNIEAWRKKQRISFEKALEKAKEKQEAAIRECKASLPEGYKVEKINGEYVAYPEGYKLKKTEKGEWVAEPPSWKERTLTGQYIKWVESQPTPEEKMKEVGVLGALYGGEKALGYFTAGLIGTIESTASFLETLIRSGAATITTGKPQLVAPEIIHAPPSPISAGIGSIWETVTTGKPTWGYEAAQYGEIEEPFRYAYLTGGIAGEILQIYAFSKISAKVSPKLAPIKTKISAKLKIPELKTALSKFYWEKRLFKLSPKWHLEAAYRGSIFHKAFTQAKYWAKEKMPWYSPYQKGFAKGEIGSLLKPRATYIGGEPYFSLSQLQREIMGREAVWTFLKGEGVKGAGYSGVAIAQPAARTGLRLQTYVFEWYFAAGAKQLVPRFRPARAEEFMPAAPQEVPLYELGRKMGFERYQWRMGAASRYFFEKPRLPTLTELRERGLLPQVTQSQVTRLGITPYVPKYKPEVKIPLLPKPIPVTKPSITSLSKIVFGAVAFAPTVAPKVKPTKMTDVTAPTRLKAPVVQKPKRLEKDILGVSPIIAPWIYEAEEAKPAVVPIAGISAATKQIMKLEVPQATVTVTTETPPPQIPDLLKPLPPKLPRKRKKKKRKKKQRIRKTKFGRYEILYPVATVSEVAKYVMGEGKK